MALRRKKSESSPLVGVAIIGVCVMALWKNETRFDYYKAAKKAEQATSTDQLIEGNNFSFSSEMDQSLQLEGKYISTFTGYLMVRRSAEIYCWDRDEDDDGVDWSLRWMSSVQSNSRNNGVTQQLQSGKITPSQYQVGELEVQSQLIEFVDPAQSIDPAPLPKTKEGRGLSLGDQYLELNKGRDRNLGDERVGFSGVPVPAMASYFGKFSDGVAVADRSQAKDGFVNKMIGNSGNLHHLVAGDREVALQSIKSHLHRVKWLVRGIATIVMLIGFLVIGSTLCQALYQIPVLGSVAEAGVFLLSLAIGLPLALLTIVSGYLAGHLILLIPILVALALAVWFVIKQMKKKSAVKQRLEAEYGYSLEADEMKKQEFREMAGMLTSDGEIGDQQAAFLERFGEEHGWDEAERQAILEEQELKGSDESSALEHLQHLIRLSVADDKLTPQEVRSIREAAMLAGYDREKFRDLMAEVQNWMDSAPKAA